MKKTIFGLNALMVFILLLTACAPAATPEPTIDANQLFTQAAMTVVAQLTQNAPTATQIPTMTKAPLATNTPLGGALPTLPPLATLPPLLAPTKAALNIADKAVYITQSPADNTNVSAGKVFNITWRLRNTGTTTWNQNYQYRYYASVNKISTAAGGYALTKTVPPNSEVDLTVVATAPSSTGTYDTQWVLTNPEGTNFSLFTLTINVVAGSGGGSSATAAPVAGNPCEDKGTIDAPGILDPSTTLNLSIPGGQVKVYFKATTSATTVLTLESPTGGTGENRNTVTVTTTEISRSIGDFSKDPSTLTLIVGATSGPVNVTKIEYWKAGTNCPL